MREKKEPKHRILIRFQPLIADCLDYQAAYEGSKIGTVANKLLLEELDKIAKVGIQNCFVRDSDEYEDALSEIQKGREAYILPAKITISKYLPSKIGRTINRQVTFLLDEEHYELLEQIVRLQDIMGTLEYGEASSFRYAIHGLLLNNPIIQRQL